MIKCLLEIQNLRQEVKVMCAEVNKAKSEIMDFQLQRQKKVWWLISQVVSQVHRNLSSGFTQNFVPFHFLSEENLNDDVKFSGGFLSG